MCWVGNALFAGHVDGEIVANPFMSENYDHWELGQGWRNDGIHNRLVFDINDLNMGSLVAVGRGKHFKFDPGTNPSGLSAKLTGFTFNTPYIQVFDSSSIGPSADYNLYFEVDIVTLVGFYRAQSQLIPKPWGLPTGDLLLDFNWLTKRGFLGDPRLTDQGGIPIDLIKEIYYKVIMQVNQATDPGTGTVFLTVDNLSLTFQAVIE